MMPSDPTNGQFFTVAPPTPQRSPLPWLLPLGIGSVAALLLIMSFGSGGQKAAEKPKPQPTQSPGLESQLQTSGFSSLPQQLPPEPSAPSQIANAPEPSPTGEQVISSETTPMQTAQISAPGVVVNFRSAPSINSPVLGVIGDGEVIETSYRLVDQNNITWIEVRYRNQSGWVASQFVTQPQVQRRG